VKTFKELIDSLVEITVGQREKKPPGEIKKDQAERRSKKADKKSYMRKYRKSATAKRHQRQAPKMARVGLTPSGDRRITVRGGAGGARRAKERKQELQKR
tara:strand:- start:81 stop:380 length:300 start_codon:yes stop_codon:yes gene_type:complete